MVCRAAFSIGGCHEVGASSFVRRCDFFPVGECELGWGLAQKATGVERGEGHEKGICDSCSYFADFDSLFCSGQKFDTTAEGTSASPRYSKASPGWSAASA